MLLYWVAIRCCIYPSNIELLAPEREQLTALAAAGGFD